MSKAVKQQQKNVIVLTANYIHVNIERDIDIDIKQKKLTEYQKIVKPQHSNTG